MFTKRIHVFKAGPQVSAQGVERDFTPKELEEVVQTYDPSTHEAPLVIGHSGDSDSAPSYGWIQNFVRKGNDLYADVNFTDVAKDLVKDGHYRKVSISFYSPSSPINPHKGKWSARHLALLGASPPAVKGLEPFSFSEEGVFNYSVTLSPEDIFDKELGPTMIVNKGPLEMLKERLEEVRSEINQSLEALKENQEDQSEVNVGQEGAVPQPPEIASTPQQQFSEKRRKKMGLEGEEVSESSQKTANMETMSPDDQYEEGVTRKKASGAHGHEVQVVEEVFEEGITRKKASGDHGQKVQVVEQVYEESPKRSKKKMDPEIEEISEEIEGEFAEGVGHKTSQNGKVAFGHHPEKGEDPSERQEKGSVDSDVDRDSVAKSREEDREGVTSDGGNQDSDRENTSSNSEQDADREKLAKATSQDGNDSESRWEGQPEAKERHLNNDQFDVGEDSLLEVQKAGISDGNEPYGRDGGPTRIPTLVEEEPSNMDVEVPLESVKDNDSVRVLYKKSGDARSTIKGKPIETGEKEFAEGVGHKTSKDGKVSFGTHPEKSEDVAGRGKTGRSESDSYADRQSVGKGETDGREMESSDEGDQDEDRIQTSKNSEMEKNREELAKAPSEDKGDAESRWEGQPESKDKVMNSDQYSDPAKGQIERQKPGISDGDEPHGRDGGPTKVSTMMEEEPSNEEIAVPLESTKGNKKARVLHTESGDQRAAVKGGKIPSHTEEVDHAEGEADGLTREPKKAKVSDGTDARGRDGGPTEFPTLSEEDPDDLEMAVDLEDATQSNKVRIIRQKSGDKPSVDHKERSKDPMTKTGKGSTYGQKTPVLVEEETEENDTEDFCGMGSMGQSKAMGFPMAMYEELKTLKEENDRLKREYEEQKTRSRKAKIAEFIDNLYVEGKLTDGIIPQRQLQNYCEGLEFGTLEFAEGESPTTTLFSLLERLPNMVYFGEVVSNSVFQAEEDEDMDPHERALKLVAEGGASDYLEAIKQCIPWGSRG